MKCPLGGACGTSDDCGGGVSDDCACGAIAGSGEGVLGMWWFCEVNRKTAVVTHGSFYRATAAGAIT